MSGRTTDRTRSGDGLHRDQDVDLDVGGLDLAGQRTGIEPGRHIVGPLPRELLDLIEGDVEIRHDQAVGANERPRPTRIEADGGQADMLEPFRRRREAIELAEPRCWRVVERPHPLVGFPACEARGTGDQHNQAEGRRG